MGQKGFTLIELVMVIVLITILAGTAIVTWPGTKINLNAQAQQLASDIRYAQSLAMTHGQRYRLNFTSTTTYTITTTAGVAVPFPVTGDTSVTLGTGITLTLPPTNLLNNLIAFDGLGIPYTNSTATTALASAATITLSASPNSNTIQINPQTGSVVVS
jgi:prepilin-type N-terminal cleavage/methylation domain-containing protein